MVAFPHWLVFDIDIIVFPPVSELCLSSGFEGLLLETMAALLLFPKAKKLINFFPPLSFCDLTNTLSKIALALSLYC